MEQDLEVIGLEHIPGDDDVYRIAMERWWMSRMGTLDEEPKKNDSLDNPGFFLKH